MSISEWVWSYWMRGSHLLFPVHCHLSMGSQSKARLDHPTSLEASPAHRKRKLNYEYKGTWLTGSDITYHSFEIADQEIQKKWFSLSKGSSYRQHHYLPLPHLLTQKQLLKGLHIQLKLMLSFGHNNWNGMGLVTGWNVSEAAILFLPSGLGCMQETLC